jgi:hypothetical protein
MSPHAPPPHTPPSPCLMVSLQLLVAAQKSCRFEASRCCASSTTLDTGSSAWGARTVGGVGGGREGEGANVRTAKGIDMRPAAPHSTQAPQPACRQGRCEMRHKGIQALWQRVDTGRE